MDEYVFDSFEELLESVEAGEYDASEISVFIDNDFVEAYIEDYDEPVENPNTVPGDWDVQLLVNEQVYPRHVLKDVLRFMEFDAENA